MQGKLELRMWRGVVREGEAFWISERREARRGDAKLDGGARWLGSGASREEAGFGASRFGGA